MDSIRFSYEETALVLPGEIDSLIAHLCPEIERVAQAWKAGYDNRYGCMQLPLDREMQASVTALAHEKKRYNPSLTILIGIGGSNLGAMAVYEAITGCQLHCADSVDTFATAQLYAQAERQLQDGKEIVLIIISKSGATTETVANAQLFTGLLKKYRANYQDFLVIISDRDSKLTTIGTTNKIECLTIPDTVGGRYSVFSAAGLFPLAMAGIDIDQLCAGAASVREQSNNALNSNHAAVRAAIVYAHYVRGIAIYDHFFFVPRLNGLGLWLRQLIAESLGKADDVHGKRVHAGIAPTVSIGSADLHSVAQLYLGGPNNRLTSFVSVHEQRSLQVPADGPFISLVPDITGKRYDQIMHAIISGVKTAYATEKRPFFSLELPAITPYYIGQFMQCAIMEVIYLGYLFQINPFDQPQVELYKKETRKILANEY